MYASECVCTQIQKEIIFWPAIWHHQTRILKTNWEHLSMENSVYLFSKSFTMMIKRLKATDFENSIYWFYANNIIQNMVATTKYLSFLQNWERFRYSYCNFIHSCIKQVFAYWIRSEPLLHMEYFVNKSV